MSRIGKKSISVPKGVEAKVSGTMLTVKGPKGSSERQLPTWLSIEFDSNYLLCKPTVDSDDVKAKWGLYRALINNMIQGVTTGYRKDLEIVGVGYKAEMKGKDVLLNVGLSHSVLIEAPTGIKISVEEQNKAFKVIVEGIESESVGQVAANIRHVRPPEPYKGKGIHYSGERIIRKVGKAAGK